MKNSKIIKIACAGDSITENGYPANLQRMLGDGYEVVNFGVSGSTNLKGGTDHNSVDCDYRHKELYRASLDFNPDIVILMLGTNDSKTMNWDRLGGNFVDDYLELIDTYKSLDSVKKIYLCTPPCAFSTAYEISPTAVEREVTVKVRETAKIAGLEIIDIYSATKGLESEFEDGIHPSTEKCRDAIAAACADAVRKYNK